MLRFWAKDESDIGLASTTLVHRAVERIDTPAVQPGQTPGHLSRALIEPGRWTEHDPFLLLAEDWFSPGTFGNHPHRGFETVTLVLDGVLEHSDNHGGAGVLGPGDAQWLTAGHGVVHKEEPLSQQVHSLQLWLNLPASEKLTPARWQDLRMNELPVRQGEGFEVRVYSGSSGDAVAKTSNHVPVTMVTMKLDPGASFTQDVPGWYNAFAYVIAGSGNFGVRRTRARAGQVVWFDNADAWAPSEITVEAGDEGLRAVLFAGEPLGEPVAARGPFVMNTLAELQQAYSDYRDGKF